MELTEIRARIDAIDEQLVRLFCQRMDVSRRVAEYKKANGKDASVIFLQNHGVFVAGDCRVKEVRQLTTAVGDGAVAALAACKYVDAL